MSNRNYNFLLVSSLPPNMSAGLGQAVIDSLTRAGNNVDFLTIYKYKGIRKNDLALRDLSLSVKVKKFLERTHLKKYLKIIISPFRGKSLSEKSRYIINNGIVIVNPDESHPDIDPKEITDIIQKKYDAVITLFWQGMINTSSLKAIYDKLHVPILIYSVDMATITGGCFSFEGCRHFENGCGRCPGFNSNSESDQSYRNYLIKKENYNSIKCAFLGNSWMNQYARPTNFFDAVCKTGIIIDDKIFHPGNKKEARKYLRIPDKYEFIFMIRSTYHPMKGNKSILEAANQFWESLDETARAKTAIITIGSSYFNDIAAGSNINIINLGIVDTKKLIKCYQAADYFISASLNDAGPSMINQSLMCGTPVLSYDSGAALDVIIDGVTGFKTSVFNSTGLYEILRRAYALSQNKYTEMCHSAREIALKENSPQAFCKNIESAMDLLGF